MNLFFILLFLVAAEAVLDNTVVVVVRCSMIFHAENLVSGPVGSGGGGKPGTRHRPMKKGEEQGVSIRI